VEVEDDKGKLLEDAGEQGHQPGLTDARRSQYHLPLRNLVHGVDVVDSLALRAVALMHGIDTPKAGLAVGRGLLALADLHRRGPGLLVMVQAQTVARAPAQVVEVAVGQRCQPLALGLAADLELALENMARGRTAEQLMRLIDRGQQVHVGHGVTAREAGPKRRLGRDPPGLDIAPNQPRGLRSAETDHVLHLGPQKPLGAPFLKRVFVIAEQQLYTAVNPRAHATGEPNTFRGGKKCLDLNQTQLLCSKHADRSSSACPPRLLQAHLAVESTLGSGFILLWTRVSLASSGGAWLKWSSHNYARNKLSLDLIASGFPTCKMGLLAKRVERSAFYTSSCISGTCRFLVILAPDAGDGGGRRRECQLPVSGGHRALDVDSTMKFAKLSHSMMVDDLFRAAK